MSEEISIPKNGEDTITGQTPPDSTPSMNSINSPQGEPVITPADEPPQQSSGQATPAESTPDPEAAQHEVTPTPEVPPTDALAVAGRQTESAPEAPSGAVEAPRGSENLEAVIDTRAVPAQSATTVIRPHGDPEEQRAVNGARLATANAKIQATKRKKLDKIMALLDKRANGSTGSPRVTNDEVEKLLRVSDATATRYLEALKKENKIKQTGKTGTAVFYEKI